ncbi:MAG: hypothetical protein ABSD29_03055 [Verrucomicrobiota bacterium]|jgi:hypothetical protein
MRPNHSTLLFTDHTQLVTCPSPRAAGPALTFVLILVLATGCSGINASQSVSPLDFLLPGLHMQNGPASPAVPLETNPSPVLAQSSPIPPVDPLTHNVPTAERKRS